MTKVFARKVIHPIGRQDVIAKEVGNESRVIEKFRRGGGHPNVVAVLAHGWIIKDQFYHIDMDLYFFSLRDFVRGRSRMKSPPISSFFAPPCASDEFSCFRFWDIIGQITRGLLFIHANGEVHRDLKPENGEFRTPVIECSNRI